VNTPPPALRGREGGVELDLLVQPRASRSACLGWHDGRLKVALAAPPVDGEANDALVRLLSDWFSCARRDVRLLSGETGRRKTVAIAGLSSAEAAGHLNRVLP
jgi:uncharacterized protein (TIGR00251 family)